MHAVVAPTELSRELMHRHYFHNRDSNVGQMLQLRNRARPGAFWSECADMHLIHDLTFNGQTSPIEIAPGVRCRVDYAGKIVRAFRLKTRGWVGVEFCSPI